MTMARIAETSGDIHHASRELSAGYSAIEPWLVLVRKAVESKPIIMKGTNLKNPGTTLDIKTAKESLHILSISSFNPNVKNAERRDRSLPRRGASVRLALEV